MQVAYYSNYFVWFEVGRCELLRSLGSSYSQLESTGCKLPVIEAHCEYQQPARYDDDLEIFTAGSLVSPARVCFAYEVRRKSTGGLAAVGRTVHAAVNSEGKPSRLPLEIRKLLA